MTESKEGTHHRGAPRCTVCRAEVSTLPDCPGAGSPPEPPRRGVDEATEIRPGVFKLRGSPRKFDFLECQDCRRPNPMGFVVHDALWTAAGLTTGVICPACFEVRIGRGLRITDFKVCPANEQIFYGFQLATQEAPHA